VTLPILLDRPGITLCGRVITRLIAWPWAQIYKISEGGLGVAQTRNGRHQRHNGGAMPRKLQNLQGPKSLSFPRLEDIICPPTWGMSIWRDSCPEGGGQGFRPLEILQFARHGATVMAFMAPFPCLRNSPDPSEIL
jgi:hypothetical protein